ncbi:VOC family protein [Novosphingopyxis sp.]|uniref:VOC family protein n=1 Tax=Novosphingopyxis sp. TaxID=2709690 RepID=UPI003B5B7F85
MANRQGDFIWYELMTTDPEGAKAFYDAVAGWDIDAESATPGDMDYRMIKRSDGGFAGGMLALSEDMRAGGARPAWLGYVHVADVDEAVAAIERNGGATRMPATTMEGVGRMAMVADPQGAPIYVMAPTPPADDAEATSDVFSVDRPGHVRWNELATCDAEAATAFYTSQFGWTQEGGMEMGAMGRYRFLMQNGTGIGAIMPKPEAMPVSAWTYYIGVDDIDRARQAVEEGGGRVISGPHEIPGGEFSLSGADPQSAAFGLVGPRKQGQA